MRQLHVEEEEAYKDKGETSTKKKTEEFLKINVHNMKRYNYIRHTKPEIVRNFSELCQK